LKWRLLSTLLLLYSAAIKIQEAKDSIDEEDPRPTSSTWSYITMLDLGASINVMPTSVYRLFHLGDLKPTGVVIHLAN